MSNLNQKLQEKNAANQQNALQQKQQTAVDWVNSPEISGLIAQALPKHITKDRILSVVGMAFRKNPKLQKCTKNSLLAAIVTASQLGLELNTPLGHACIIPYENKKFIDGQWEKVIEAEFQMEYQGIIDLCYRTGEYETIYAEEVDKADKFEMELGLNKRLIHVPSDEPAGEIKGYYAVYRLKNGGYDFKYMSLKMITDWAKRYSPGYRQMERDLRENKDPKNNAWYTSFAQMAKKTVLKQVLKYAPKSTELARQLTLDETVKKEISEDMSIVPDVIDYDVNYTIEPVEEAPEEEVHQDDVKKNSESVEKEAKQSKKQTKKKEEPKVESAEEMLNRDPAEEAIRAQKEMDCKRIHIRIGELNNACNPLGKQYTDAKYREDLKNMFGVSSSKELSHQQAEQFIKYLKEMEEIAAAQSKKQSQNNHGLDETELLNEAQDAFSDSLANKVRAATGQPPRDFVGEARKAMLMNQYKAGQPLWKGEYEEIGIDISTVPPEKIKTGSEFETQVDMFGGEPSFMKKQDWEE